jgi:gentisate 1,2-dioxygenase
MTGTLSSTGGPLQPPLAHTIHIENDSQERLLSEIPHVAALPLWKQMSVLVPARPKPKAVAHKWA